LALLNPIFGCARGQKLPYLSFFVTARTRHKLFTSNHSQFEQVVC